MGKEKYLKREKEKENLKSEGGRRNKKRRRKEENEKVTESTIRETNNEDLQKEVYTWVAIYIWRIDLGFYKKTEDQRIFLVVRKSRKIVSIKVSVQAYQP